MPAFFCGWPFALLYSPRDWFTTYLLPLLILQTHTIAQGEFAFVIYDNKHKQPFAARDPSGEECLYYHVSEDGAVSFASSRLEIPDGEQPHEWRELPPGHYISGGQEIEHTNSGRMCLGTPCVL
jgi:hypothetical protein